MNIDSINFSRGVIPVIFEMVASIDTKFKRCSKFLTSVEEFYYIEIEVLVSAILGVYVSNNSCYILH